MQTKPAEVAGMFYPAEVRVLKQIIADCLSKANTDNTTLPKVIIAPHAGYIYSGEIAANAYSILKTHADSIKRVVLLGPAHRMAFRGIAVHPADDFATPLGQVTLDTEFIKHLAVLPDVELLKRPFHNEHCLEVQLPFLQTLLTDFKIIPVIVGDSSPENVARLLNKVWGDASTLIVISTDMSHYHPYNDANKIDKATAQAIVDLNLDLVQPDKACGSRPLKGLLKVAKHRQMQCNLLDLRNSGDTQGDKSRVVGYAAYHVFENKNILALTNLAKQSIEYGLKHRKALSFKQVDIKGDLEKPGACFVTLEINGQLRGCIGSLIATRSLGEDIITNAYNAAFADPRFIPLSAEEFNLCDIHLSILTEPEPIAFNSEQDLISKIQPDIDGLILEADGHRGTFLPSVWDQIATPKEFLQHLKQKAGLPMDYWSDNVKISRYRTEQY